MGCSTCCCYKHPSLSTLVPHSPVLTPAATNQVINLDCVLSYCNPIYIYADIQGCIFILQNWDIHSFLIIFCSYSLYKSLSVICYNKVILFVNCIILHFVNVPQLFSAGPLFKATCLLVKTGNCTIFFLVGIFWCTICTIQLLNIIFFFPSEMIVQLGIQFLGCSPFVLLVYRYCAHFFLASGIAVENSKATLVFFPFAGNSFVTAGSL